MATTVSLINMKGGVGKTTLAFNLSWYCAWKANMKVLAVDLDPQSNLSQYFMGAKSYLDYLDAQLPTVVEVFEQFSPPRISKASPSPLIPSKVIHHLREWDDGSCLNESLEEFRLRHKHHTLEMSGIIFNDKRRIAAPPEQRASIKEVKKAAGQYGWPVFDNAAHHSDSFPTGSRASTPIFSNWLRAGLCQG